MLYKNRSFKEAQMITLILCVTGYTVSYLCRTNLSVSLYKIIDEYGITASTAGLLGTMYFWSYAIGQLFSGWINSFISSKILFTLGLIASALTNLMIGFSHSYGMIMLMWTLNGLGLAFLWTPLISIISKWFRPEEFSKITLFLSLPTTVGYIISWGLLDPMMKATSWRIAFTFPAAVAIGFVLIWIIGIRISPETAGFEKYIEDIEVPISDNTGETHMDTSGKIPLKNIFLSSTMIVFIILLLSFGCIKEGVSFWAPSLITDGLGINGILPVLLIPAFSTVGLIMSTWLIRKLHDNLDGVFTVLLILGTASGGVLAIFSNQIWIAIICLSVMMAVLCGAIAILTTLVPLRFAHTGHGTKITGIMNFTAYLGAALGGVVSGTISDSFGWSGVFVMWASIMAASLVIFMCVAVVKRGR